MGLRPGIVVGSAVTHRKTGERGVVQGMRFSPRPPYSPREVQVRWEHLGRLPSWIAIQKVRRG